MVAYESLKTKEKSTWVIPKVVAVAYGSGRLWEFKNKGEVQLGNPKSGRGGLRERSLMRAFYYKV